MAGGGGGGGSGGGGGGAHGGGSGGGFAGYGGAAGAGTSWGGHGGAGETSFLRGPDGRLYPWIVDPQDPYGIPTEFSGLELRGNQLVDTRGYMLPGGGQDFSRNSAPMSAMVPDFRGGERLDPRFVGHFQRNEGQSAGLRGRGFDDLTLPGPGPTPESFGRFGALQAPMMPIQSPRMVAKNFRR